MSGEYLVQVKKRKRRKKKKTKIFFFAHQHSDPRILGSMTVNQGYQSNESIALPRLVFGR